MKRVVRWALIVMCAALWGCSNIPDPREVSHDRILENRETLKHLRIGIDRAEVLRIMGSPQDTSPGPRQARHLAYWLYQTQERDLTSWALGGNCFTWLAFEDERLVAIGAAHEVIPFNKSHPLWRSD